MRIGIVTAMVEETVPIITKLGGVVAEDNIAGVRIVQIEAGGHTVYLANSGIGEIRAALAVQLLVDLFDIEVVLNFGFVGSLTGSLLVGETVIAGRAVHHQFDLSAVDGTPAGEYDGRGTVFFETDREIADRFLASPRCPLLSAWSPSRAVTSSSATARPKSGCETSSGRTFAKWSLRGYASPQSATGSPCSL